MGARTAASPRRRAARAAVLFAVAVTVAAAAAPAAHANGGTRPSDAHVLVADRQVSGTAPAMSAPTDGLQPWQHLGSPAVQFYRFQLAAGGQLRMRASADKGVNVCLLDPSVNDSNLTDPGRTCFDDWSIGRQDEGESGPVPVAGSWLIVVYEPSSTDATDWAYRLTVTGNERFRSRLTIHGHKTSKLLAQFQVFGRLTPTDPSAPVWFQRKTHGRWRTIEVMTCTASGRWGNAVDMRRGLNRFRAVFPGDSGQLPARSPTIKVRSRSGTPKPSPYGGLFAGPH